MKKINLLLSIIISFFGFSFSQTLIITNPSGTVTWELNSTHMIEWNYGGSGDIMIQLYQSGLPVGTIYNGANSGSFSWKIDKYLNSKPIITGNYKLRVRSKQDSSKYAEVNLIIKKSSPYLLNNHFLNFLPDLRVRISVIPGPLHYKTLFMMVVYNDGKVNSKSFILNWRVYYKNKNGEWKSDFEYQKIIDGIKAGGRYTHAVGDYNFPWAGKWKITAWVDKYNAIKETNENNNYNVVEFEIKQ